MKILYLYQYYSTSHGSWGTRVHEFTSEWVKQKDINVQVCTSLYYKSDLISKGLFNRQVIDGVDVDIIGIRVNKKDSTGKRIFSFIAYSFVSSVVALFGKYDLAISSSGPISVGLPVLIAKKLDIHKLLIPSHHQLN